MNWQPIETAPKDGSEVKTCHIGKIYKIPGYALTSRFIDGDWCAKFGEDRWERYAPQPTHWMPLPPPPNSQE